MNEEKKSKVDVKAERGDLEQYPHPGLLVLEVMQEEGVEMFFGVAAGHHWGIVDEMQKAGIKHVTMRNEMQGGHAAEAYARVSGKIGVCNGTAGPGATNLVSGVHQAYLSDTPLLAILGGHEVTGDFTHTLQEAYPEKMFAASAKMTKRIVEPTTLKYWLRRAFRTAMAYPRGPAVLDFAVSVLTGPHPAENWLYLENWLKEPMAPSYPDPATIERALEIIYATEKPVLYAGDEVLWNQADTELREFARLAQIPVMGRKGARGALPEDDPLIWKAGGVGLEADLFISLGARMDYFDFWGFRFMIKRSIQIAEAHDYIAPWIPTEIAINANVKSTLKAMIDCIKRNRPTPHSGRAAWLEKVREAEKKRVNYLEKKALNFKDRAPIHYGWLSKIICNTIDEMYGGDAYYIFDAFTGSNFLTPYVTAKFAGSVLDSGPHAGVGHGVGMAIGASYGCDKKKMVFAMMGDAGMGVGGMDVETALRHQLPIVYLVNNNDGWMSSNEMVYGRNMGWYGAPPGWPLHSRFIENQRYDLMFKPIGCHGEWVTAPDQIRPALERAFKSAEKGIPAVVNVDVDRKPVTSLIDTEMVNNIWRFLPWNEMSRFARKMRVRWLYNQFNFEKYGIKPEDHENYDRWDPDEEDMEFGIPE